MKTNKTYKQRGFSLIELLIVILISSILIIVALPSLTRKLIANNPDVTVLKCVKKEFASNLSSDACSKAINHCLYGINQACTSISNLIEEGRDNERMAARNLMAATCDRGGEDACAYMVTSCVKDSNACNTGYGNDLNKYLKLAISIDSPAKIPIAKYAGAYFNSDNTNIINELNSDCCNSGLTLACSINGTNSCAWQISINNYINNYYERGKSIAIDNTGNIYAGGYTTNSSPIDSDVLIKVDPKGTIIWKKMLVLSNGKNNQIHGIAVDSSGNVYATGYVGNGTDADISVLKLDTNGNILWQTTYASASNGDDKGNGIAVDKNGNVYVVGQTYNSSSLNDILVMKFDSNGTLTWQKIIQTGTNNRDYGNAIAIDSNGDVYIAGNSAASNLVVIKLSSSGTGGPSGDGIIWKKSFSSVSETNGIAIDKNTNVYAVGNTGADIALVKLDSNDGSTLWIDNITNSTHSDTDAGYAIAVDRSNNVYITGLSSASNADLAIVKINSNHTMVWSKAIPSNDGNLDTGTGIAVDKSWHVFVTGYTTTSSDTNMPILKFNWKQDNNDLKIIAPTFSASSLTYSTGSYTLSQTTFPTFNGSVNLGASNLPTFPTSYFNQAY